MTDKFIDDLLTGAYADDVVYSEYVKKVGCFGVDQLIKEPNRLNEDKDQLQKQTQELAFCNYKTFIQTADCSRELFNRFNATESSLNSMISDLPKLKAECQAVAKASENVNQRKKQNGQVLSKISQLLDFLELPQLMDSCIRRGQFEEALELFSYARRLGSKHGSVPLIVSVVAELEGSWRGMVHQLLAQLRADLPLPKCLQIIGFLRRMDVFTDPELRLQFLQAREAFLKNLLASIVVAPGENISLKKLEVLRVQLFNVVTQYRAIFSDEDISLSASEVNESCIFYAWLTDKVSQILTVIEEASTGKQGTGLDAALGQAMYFGLSFSRVGVDFRGLVALRFHRIVLNLVEGGLRRTAKRFEQEMDRYVLSPTESFFSTTSTTDGPPLVLLEFAPLAELANGILRIFNELRGCAPLSVAQGVTHCLQDVLRTCTKTILGFYRQEQTALGPGEMATLSRLCQAYQELITYLSKCLTLLFPLQALAHHLGLPVHQIQNLSLVSLKEETLLEPLNNFFPRQEITSPP